jgi:hypothetical protein
MLTARALLFSACLPLLIGSGCDSSDPVTPDVDLVTNVGAEPPGANCAHGGAVVHSGHDADHDGALDDDEIESVDYVCSPAIPTRVREDKLAAGAVCPSGGTSVHSGRDLDRDAILDDSEIEHTVNVCDVKELWSGDLDTSTWTTPEAQAALAQVRVITGSLKVDSDAALPALELVGGNVSLTAATQLIELPALTRVVGGVTVSSATATDVVLPELEEVGAGVAVTATAAKAVVAAPLLETIAGDFVLGESQQAAFDMDALKEIGGNFVLDGKPGALTVPVLAKLGGSLRLESVDMSSLQLPGLQTIGGDIFVWSNVKSIELAALQTVGGGVDVMNASSLLALQFPSLTTVGGKFELSTTTSLATLGLGALTSIGGELHIVGTQLTQLQLPQLRELGRETTPGYAFEIHNASKLTSISVPLLKHSTGMIQITQCGALTAVQFPALMRAHGLVVDSSPNVTEVSAPKLTNVNVLQVSALPKLATIAFGAVPRVDGTVYISGTALTDLGGLSGLTSTRFLTIENNAALTDISALASLAYVALDLEIEGNPQLPAAEIQSLKTRLGY